jgi:hypothetical protein
VVAAHSKYGSLNLLADTRDWNKEAREEWLDMHFYLAAGELSGGTK